MAWRLEEAVEHGLIDNTVEGITTGKIWLVGRDEPLILSLDGDCWRDLAGTVLEFENPEPRHCPDAVKLDTDQGGVVGDITASRKARVPQASSGELLRDGWPEEGIPYEWCNVLYIEWFSEINGRVLIEAAGYRLHVTPHNWQMDEDQEAAQRMANLGAMRDFLTRMIGRTEQGDSEPKGELDEYEWEERLKESDRLSEAYQEVLDKYMDDEDSEQKEAFVMGWDGLLGAMAERDENGGEGGDERFGSGWDGEEDEDPADEEGDWNEDNHPLQARAQDLTIRCFDLVNRENGDDSPSQRLLGGLTQVSSKLAGVLHGHGDGYEPEAGFVLAVLRRCLNWIGEAEAACGELIADCDDPDGKAALENIRTEISAIRDGITELRRELKRG